MEVPLYVHNNYRIAGNFSWGKIFVIFVGKLTSTKF